MAGHVDERLVVAVVLDGIAGHTAHVGGEHRFCLGHPCQLAGCVHGWPGYCHDAENEDAGDRRVELAARQCFGLH